MVSTVDLQIHIVLFVTESNRLVLIFIYVQRSTATRLIQLYLSKVSQSHNRVANKKDGNAFYLLLSLQYPHYHTELMITCKTTWTQMQESLLCLKGHSYIQSEHYYLCSDWEKAAIKKRITSLSCLTYWNLIPLLLLLLLGNEQY